MNHCQRESGCDRSIHCVAAGLQHFDASAGGKFVNACHHGVGPVNRTKRSGHEVCGKQNDNAGGR